MADVPLRYRPGQAVTFTASAAITGGQAVKVSGNMAVTPTTAAGDTCVGQAVTDAVANGQVMVGTPGPVATFTASAAIAAGDHVGPGAVAGQITTVAFGVGSVGVALEAIAVGATGRVLLGRL